MPLIYWPITFMMRVALLLLSRWQVAGRENVPRQGPLIVVANHMSFIDPPLLSASLPRRLRFMAKQEIFRPLPLRLLFSGWGAFPVRRGRGSRDALREADKTLGHGLALALFPEGRRSRGQLQRARRGTALLALRSGAPLLPVAITGSQRIRSFGDIFRRPTITVTVGPPFQIEPPSGRATAQQLGALADTIMEHIARLLPEDYRGAYSQTALSAAPTSTA